MCLIVFGLRSHPDYPLIVAANRDEYYQRPTDNASLWQPVPGGETVLSGRDLQAGGTWMGVRANGRFAAVTNIRNGHINSDRPRSRGQLVLDSLLSPDAAAHLQQLQSQAAQFNGFNLLSGSADSLWYSSNIDTFGSDAGQRQQGANRELAAGVYGLSNGLLDSPWPKVERSRQGLLQCLQRDWSNPAARCDELFDLLADASAAPVAQLPQTGIPLEREIQLSSAFIHSADYGTRASTLALFHRRHGWQFIERQFNEQGISGEQSWQLG
ncbi:NRDE family protein [Pseudomaricurvus sp. HS19]|uniref:NRDE family protein n=1 Tax=Pseudomaricurvus sp. HS19 TaxID=2692626 RepID=UPI00136D50BC|nr:NRDE family protein [Pseudomaricurvus sp. HS19]MYM63488.1 hypothetical protein [Pseudomaricurvus sp. HS19]